MGKRIPYEWDHGNKTGVCTWLKEGNWLNQNWDKERRLLTIDHKRARLQSSGLTSQVLREPQAVRTTFLSVRQVKTVTLRRGNHLFSKVNITCMLNLTEQRQCLQFQSLLLFFPETRNCFRNIKIAKLIWMKLNNLKLYKDKFSKILSTNPLLKGITSIFN